MAWALGAGSFIVFGGGFKSDVYQALLDTFHCTRIIGAALIFGGLLGVIGTWLDVRMLTRASCVLCATWHGMFFGYLVPANWGAFGNSNLISLFALVMALLYLVQLYAIWWPPTDRAITR